MLDNDYDTTTITMMSGAHNHLEGQSDDSGYTASPQSPSHPDFEVQECKPTPCSFVDGATEHLSLFEGSSISHIPVFIPMIKSPIVLLEKCDKIWNTLQLIKTMQCENATSSSDDGCNKEKEEEILYPIKTEQTVSDIKSHLRPRNKGMPFSFLIQKTRKLYPCVTCGKQYLERRSLRKHSERVHGVVLPLLKKHKRRNNLKNKMDFHKDGSSFDKEHNNLKKLQNNKDLYETTRRCHTAQLPMTNPLKRTRNTMSKMASRFDQSNKIATMPSSSEKQECALCRQKVKSVKQHLINYHKIGCSSSMMKQLELSLSIDNGTSGDNKTMSKSMLPGKSSQTSVDVRDESRIMDNEGKPYETSQVRKKRKYTISYANAKKRLRLDMNRYVSVPNATMVKQRFTLSGKSYKCEICLGIYASANSYAKHRRIHRIRGETKENFHKFKCRYFNSPLNKKNRLSRSSMDLTNTVVKGASNSEDLHSSILKRKILNENSKTSRIKQTDTCSGRISKGNNTTCICGRSFRNPHTLFVHKNKCKLCNNEDEMIHDTDDARDMDSNDKDSGSGINITIKKRNNSYEIVGKDGDEDKLHKPDYFEDGSSDTHVRYQQPHTSVLSEYSKDHSILKLQKANDEDVIIDIEDDVQIISDENSETKQMVTYGNNKNDLQKEQNSDGGSTENKEVSDKVRTLKEMCQEVLDELATTHKPEDAVRPQEKDLLLTKNIEEEHSYNETNVCMIKLDISSTCGYCNQQFATPSLYSKHQCTVREGKEFVEFSQHLLCFCCSEILDNFNDFDSHMKREHFDNAYHCYQCPNRFLTDRERRRHYRAEHNDTSCRFCSKKLATSVKALHEAYHLGFGHPCHKCKKAYSAKKKLAYHNSTIHAKEAENSIICNICLKPVKLKSFRSHMYSHNPNECHFCGKLFTNRTGMEYHTLVYHRGTTSKLKCNICNTRFFTRKQLEKHETNGCANI